MSMKTSPALRHPGLMNAFTCGVGLSLVWLLIAFLIHLLLRQSLRTSFALSFMSIVIVLFIVLVGGWIYMKHAAGPVILDCGPFSKKTLSYINVGIKAGLLFFLATTGAFSQLGEISGLGRTGEIFIIVFLIIGLFFDLIIENGRLQVRENGLWCYWGLVKWSRLENKLQSFYWEGEEKCFLYLQMKNRIPFLGKGRLPVDRKYKDEIDKLLRKHCSLSES